MKLKKYIKEIALDYISNESKYLCNLCDQCKSSLPQEKIYVLEWGPYEYSFCGWQCENNFRRIKSYKYHKEIGIKNHILGDFILPMYYRES